MITDRKGVLLPYMKKISFVIRTKNEERKLESVLCSILNQNSEYEVEIIIVDSGSIDNTLSIAKKYNCKIITIKPEDFSWGYALNKGVSQAQGDTIAIISGHCIFENQNCLQNLYTTYNLNPEISVIYGRQCGDAKEDPFECCDLNHFYPIEDTLKYIENNIYKLTISNACCFFKSSVWEKNKFDEILQSCEDTKWAEDVLNSGYKIGYLSSISVIHSHPLNFIYLYKKVYWRELAMVKIRKEHHSKIYYFLKFIVKQFVRELLFYIRKFKIIDEKVPFYLIFTFVFVTKIAMFNACVSKYNDQVKYEELITPKIVTRLNTLFEFDN